jgi:hypothetical protein
MEKIFPKAGTILVPKPEYKCCFLPGAKHTVTEEEERQHGELGEAWMILKENNEQKAVEKS